MPRRKLKRKLILVLASLLLIYFVGYGFCRYQKMIVHSAASAAGKCTFHDVSAGDYKMGSLNPAAALVYTPLRYLEMVYWKLKKPIGSAC